MADLPKYPQRRRCENTSDTSFKVRLRRIFALGPALVPRWSAPYEHPQGNVQTSTFDEDYDGDGEDEEITVHEDLGPPMWFFYPILHKGRLVVGIKTGGPPADKLYLRLYDVLTGQLVSQTEVTEAQGVWQDKEGEMVALGDCLCWLEWAGHPTAWLRRLTGKDVR